MQIRHNALSVLLTALAFLLTALPAKADELTFQNLTNAYKVEVGMSEQEVLATMGAEPATGLLFSDNYSEWHYCQTVEGLNEYFAVFLYGEKRVLGTKRYVVGRSNGLEPGSCEASTRRGSFGIPQSVTEQMDEDTLTTVTGQWELDISLYDQRFKAQRLAEQAKKEEARAKQEERLREIAAAREERERERKAAAEKAAQEQAEQEAKLAALGYKRYDQARFINDMREIRSITPDGAVQIVQINTTAMSELLELIVLQNDMIIELLEKQAEKE